MTLDEAKQSLVNKGWPAGTPMTLEVLEAEGWEPTDYFAGAQEPAPQLSEGEIKNQVSLLVEEAKAHGVGAEIIQGIVMIGKIALKAVV